jgi:hypothetical protein
MPDASKYREQTVMVKCGFCELPMPRRKAHGFRIYTPWQPLGSDVEPDVFYPLCWNCQQKHHYTTPAFWCSRCGRDVWWSAGLRNNVKKDPEKSIRYAPGAINATCSRTAIASRS